MSNRWASRLCLLVLLAACNSEPPAVQRVRPPSDDPRLAQSDCEQASHEVINELRDAENVAIATVTDPAQKQARQAALKTRLEHVDRYFVGHCLKLPADGMKCIDDAQDYVKALREQRSELLLCNADVQRGEVKPPEEVERCRREVDARAHQRIGQCGAVIEQVLVAVDIEAAEAAKK